MADLPVGKVFCALDERMEYTQGNKRLLLFLLQVFQDCYAIERFAKVLHIQFVKVTLYKKPYDQNFQNLKSLGYTVFSVLKL